jgi:hypothetical protein
VVNVNPFSYGHFANGGKTIAYVEKNCIMHMERKEEKK